MRLIVDGAVVNGCRSAEIGLPRSSRAASFRIHASATEITRILGLGWVDADQLDVAVEFGMLPSGADEEDLDWVRMVTGVADRISLDQASGTVSFDGRDHAARLIDLALQDGYLNKTASEIAATLAARCQLTADLDPTSKLVGQYYQIQHTKSALAGFSRHANGWDLLAELADLEGYELWVDGTTLHFKKPVSDMSDLFEVHYAPPGIQSASPTLSISHLTMDRSFGLTGSVQVKVSSWNSRQRQQVTARYPQTVTGDIREFQVIKPNLLQDDAELLAQNIFSRLRAHERVISGSMAGELDLTARHRLRLSGTGTSWDRIYTIDRIEREMSLDGGFIQHITARIDSGEGAASG
ncbi:hypothetical protein HN018_10795 [Lichenicola cladoniae]|uniref:Phage protein D n=1 Tax=Lichenicola cladoniae TaxID=1484109 RepID=A0A6M8HQ44_9PROT|nr:hypothetical protein [Lichenicola cladoniae]NPD67854.1 hypothetical protein [Acetobacteraceae bacterium]QKE90458.1 hypothetical protein HN018_10795 [Lichenicola cladoniae]